MEEVNIPEGWEIAEFKKVLQYEQPYRYTVNSTEYDEHNGTPVLTAGKSFILGYTHEQIDIYSNIPVIIFDDFTTDSKYVDFPFKVKSSAMKFLKVKDGVKADLKLLFERLNQIKLSSTGGEHKRRWISEYSKIKIVLPKKLEEQQKIAEILSKVDKAIVQTEAQIEKYNRIKTGLMQDLLTKGIDEQGNIRSETTHEFKDSPLGRIPKEWETLPIDKLCSLIVDCKNRTCPFIEQSSYPVIRTSNIKNGTLVWNDMKYTDKISYKIWTDRAIPQHEDVIITREAPLGQVFKIPRGLTPVLGQRTMMYRLDKSKLTPDFLVNTVLLDKTQSYFNQISGGSTVHHLKVGEMRSFLIAIPQDVNEQKTIDENLNSLENVINTLKEKSIKLQSLKTGLMQDLLSGKVRVNHLLKKENSAA